MLAISDTAWHVWFWSQDGKRVLTGIVEDDAEVVSKLKLLAAELSLNVEISKVAPIIPDKSVATANPAPLSIPENWRTRKLKPEDRKG